MDANLIEQLRQVKDFRTKDGQRHQLWLVLLFVIMGTMSGYVGYRAWGDFVKRHRRVLIDKFGIQKHGVPSYSTIRRILMGVDFDNPCQNIQSVGTKLLSCGYIRVVWN